MSINHEFEKEFVSWLKAKPIAELDQEYPYTDCRNCPFASFLKSKGYPHPLVSSNWYYTDYNSPDSQGFTPELRKALSESRTYGELLRRLQRET